MKRRSFLQYIIGGVTALFLPKAKTEDSWKVYVELYDGRGNSDNIEIIYGAKRPHLNKRKGYTRGKFNSIDFSPDRIIAISNIEGRLIVDCEHSIWEIEENAYGDGFQKKLISYL